MTTDEVRCQAIIDAARDLFLAEGVEGVTMRKVARAVGISAPAIAELLGRQADRVALPPSRPLPTAASHIPD